VLRQAISLLAPPRCGACAEPCAASEALCANCRQAIGPPGRTTLAEIGQVCWASPYDGAARRALTALKFAARIRLAHPLGALTAAACEDLAADRTVVAVPPGRRRLRSRGFDPAALIAAAVAERLGLPRANCLRRIDHRRQVGRPRSERLGAPPSVGAIGPAPPSVLLVDDVLTTGATLAACATVLRDTGCESLAAVCFARSL
jgi:predicted amidophosphoribosyltransferase